MIIGRSQQDSLSSYVTEEKMSEYGDQLVSSMAGPMEYPIIVIISRSKASNLWMLLISSSKTLNKLLGFLMNKPGQVIKDAVA